MSTLSEFSFAVITLLVVPGPTNTLLATSGAAVGMRRSLRLLPVELAGYLMAIVVWKHIIDPFASSHAMVSPILKLLAYDYLAFVSRSLLLVRTSPSRAVDP